jgi:hypothetical protein
MESFRFSIDSADKSGSVKPHDVIVSGVQRKDFCITIFICIF